MMRPTVRLPLLALALAGAAHAETSPYYFGASQAFTRDSNVFRTPSATSDVVSSTGIFGGIDQTFSRQHLTADLAANWNRYQDIKELDHTDGHLNARLDWETVEHISGDIRFSHERSLYQDFATAAAAQGKTLLRTTDAAFNARIGLPTHFAIEGGIYGNRTNYDGALSQSDVKYDGYRVGLRWSPTDLIWFTLGGRHAKGDYPNALTDLSFRRNDIDFTAGWRPTGLSTLDARISRSRWSYNDNAASQRDKQFTTGMLSYRWQPDGKIRLTGLLQRDNNAGQYGFDVGTAVDIITGEVSDIRNVGSQTRIADTAALTALYQATGKISITADLRRIHRSLDNIITQTIGGVGSPVTQSASDNTTAASLGATWDVQRWLRLGCGLSHLKRTFSGDPGLTYPYSVNLTTCNAQVTFQP
jgi:hypothetical protein